MKTASILPPSTGLPGLDKVIQSLLKETPFAETMRTLLRTVADAYSHPVDIEFTANFMDDGQFRVNVVQCRPFQVKIKGEGSRVKPLKHLAPEQVLL